MEGGYDVGINIEKQYDKIYRYCYFKLNNAHLAEDITQETFLRFLESDSYKDAGRPLAYLYKIASNLCIDEYRKKKPSYIADDELFTEISDKLVVNPFEQEIVDRITIKEAMDELTKEQKEMLLLRYVNDVPVSVLCGMYGKSRFALYREFAKITKCLERRISK